MADRDDYQGEEFYHQETAFEALAFPRGFIIALGIVALACVVAILAMWMT